MNIHQLLEPLLEFLDKAAEHYTDVEEVRITMDPSAWDTALLSLTPQFVLPPEQQKRWADAWVNRKNGDSFTVCERLVRLVFVRGAMAEADLTVAQAYTDLADILADCRYFERRCDLYRDALDAIADALHKDLPLTALGIIENALMAKDEED